MATYSEHYQLLQWEGSDPFLRTDFNEDLKKIDAALAAAKTGPACVTGNYSGYGAEVTVALGFRPSFLVISPINRSGGYSSDVLCLMGGEEAMIKIPEYSSNEIYQNMVFSEADFTVPVDSGMVNKDVRFSYTAFY